MRLLVTGDVGFSSPLSIRVAMGNKSLTLAPSNGLNS